MVSTAYPPSIGGAQLHARELARALQRAGHEVHVATVWRESRSDWLRGTTVRARRGLGEIEVVEGVPVHPLGVDGRARAAAVALGWYPVVLSGVGEERFLHAASGMFATALRQVVDQVKPDVVHASRIGRVHPYLAARSVARRAGVPMVLTPNHHAQWVRRRDRWWWGLYRDADAVLALTDAEVAALVDGGVDPARVHRTTVGIVGTPHTGADDRGPVVTFVGQAHAYKGIDLLATAWPRVQARVPGAHLHVVGPWHRGQRRLREHLASLAGVSVHGQVEDDVKWDLLARTAVLAVPSRAESLGGVYLEAWAAGAVPVGADIPPVRELLEGAGRVVPRDATALADAIVALLTDPAARHAAVTAGRRRLAEVHDWDRIAQVTTAVYAEAGRA